jgi:hypothetical protein
MIRTAVAAAVLLSSLAAPLAAQARVVHIYSCVARSPNGSFGYSNNIPNLATARSIALTQCAVRTPRGLICRIRSCR